MLQLSAVTIIQYTFTLEFRQNQKLTEDNQEFGGFSERQI